MISHQQQNLQYDPYLPLLDSEQVLKTAQYKQNLADENMAAIKDAVDSYSKLRSYMINDVSRNYFDQELTKLTNTIKQSAGLDFSNKGNLANVLAVGRPFENDKIIINNLKVGKERERRQTDLEKVSSDLRNEDNDIVYMNDIYEYMQSNDLNATVQMGKEYTPYVDVTEEILKIEKEVDAEINEVNVERIGGGLLNAQEIQIKRKQAVMDRIKNLSPEHQRQIQVHAQANMYRMGKEGTYNFLKNYFVTQREMSNVKLGIYNKGLAEARLNLQKSNTAKNRQAVAEAQALIKATAQEIQGYDEEIAAPPDQFDVNQYVGIFQNEFLSGIAEKAAYQKVKNNIKTDEIALTKIRHDNQMAEIRESNRLQTNLNLRKELVNNYAAGKSLSWKGGEGANSTLGFLRSLNNETISNALLGTVGGNSDEQKDRNKQFRIIAQELRDLASNESNDNKRKLLEDHAILMTQLSQVIGDTARTTATKITSDVPIGTREVIKNGKTVSESIMGEELVPNYIDMGTETQEAMGGYVSDKLIPAQNVYSMKVETILHGGQFTIMAPKPGGLLYQRITSQWKPEKK
jgi:hypothetical protein